MERDGEGEREREREKERVSTLTEVVAASCTHFIIVFLSILATLSFSASLKHCKYYA